MSYCSKCGNKVEETMTFCPRCGAPLKDVSGVTAASKPKRDEKSEKSEKDEKGEKNEKDEKNEKHEKGEYGFIGWLIGGLVLIFIGIMYFVNLYYQWASTARIGALLLLIIGVVVIVVGVYIGLNARKKHPLPS